MPIHDWTRVEAGIFHDFHLGWIWTLRHALNAGVLPEGYYALAEQVAGGLEPDVLTLETTSSNSPEEASSHSNGCPDGPAGLAVATAPPQVRFTESAQSPPRRKRNRIAIRHVSGDRVVALVEIVSPGNKSSKNAIRSFVNKAVEYLDAGIHLLVLDLFPPGRRDPQGIHAAIWGAITKHDFELPADKPLTLAAYSGGDVKHAYIEPVAVGDALPTMPLFLDPDTYVPAPLEPSYQAAFQEVPRRWRDVIVPPTKP